MDGQEKSKPLTRILFEIQGLLKRGEVSKDNLITWLRAMKIRPKKAPLKKLEDHTQPK